MIAAQETVAAVARVRQLGDDALIASTQRLLREERTLSARVLVHLGEVDVRQLYRQHAYSSMFEYCIQALHFSEDEAYLRIGAARTARRFPSVLRLFAAGELHLSALKLLAPVLDDANCEELLTAARCKSKREVELLLARRREQPDVPSVLRRLPLPARATSAQSVDSAQTELLAAAAQARTEPQPETALGQQAPQPVPPPRSWNERSTCGSPPA